MSINKDGIAYFLCDVVGTRKCDEYSIEVLCSHAPGRYQLYAAHLVAYCEAFHWLEKEDGRYTLSKEILEKKNNKKRLNEILVSDTLRVLFEEEIMTPKMFEFDTITNRIVFRNEMLPLEYSNIRNTLISQGLFEVTRNHQRSTFYVSDDYRSLLSQRIKTEKRKVSIEQLKKDLELREEAGEKAEKYVYEYELRRLPQQDHSRIQIISSFDVSAGYDIVSFETNESQEIDRYIEVKAINREGGFYWSENEYAVARLKGNHYYLYLVDLTRVMEEDYNPLMICNPADCIMQSDNWLIETQTYYIRSVAV